MAERKQTKPVPDPLVEALMPDPAKGSPNAAVLRGFLGASTKAGEWRLYLNGALDSHVVIPEDKILHTEQPPGMWGTLVWVPQDLELKAYGPEPEKASARFLGGSIVAGHLAAAAISPFVLTNAIRAGWAVQTINPSGYPCPTTEHPGGGGGTQM